MELWGLHTGKEARNSIEVVDQTTTIKVGLRDTTLKSPTS